MDGERDKLIVIFPGLNGMADIPMLYYAGVKYIWKGYSCVKIDYKGTKNIEAMKAAAAERMRDILFKHYKDILFVSKSMGTLIAAWAEDEFGLKARHIFLTPITRTMEYIHEGKDIQLVVAGTNDSHIDATALRIHCERENVRLELVAGADHSLFVSESMDENIEVLRRIVGFY
jgi:phosphoglycolate phosphatase